MFLVVGSLVVWASSIVLMNICLFSYCFINALKMFGYPCSKYFPQFIICLLIFHVFLMFIRFKFVCNQKHVYLKFYPSCEKFFPILKLFQFSTTFFLLFNGFVVYNELLFLFDICFDVQCDMST